MQRLRELLTGGAGGASRAADVGLLAVRLFAGLGLAFGHGMGKLPPSPRFLAGVEEMGFPAPAVFGWAAALAEAVGGTLIAVGILTRPAALFVLFTMLVAAFMREGPAFADKEKALLYGAVALMLVLTGAGRYSLDAALARRRRPGPATQATS
jgi:putative oxidoreductase